MPCAISTSRAFARVRMRERPDGTAPRMAQERQGVGMVMRSKVMMDTASLASAVTSILAVGDAHGQTADDIAAALDAPVGGRSLQRELEALVKRGILDRRGVSHGALYTVATPAPGARLLRPRMRPAVRRAALTAPQGATA